MGEHYKHLSFSDRMKMETMLNTNHSVIEIARYLKVHRSTIYREIKRGKYLHRNTDYTEKYRYSCDLGQSRHEWNAQAKGKTLKIGNDIKYAECIERKIVEEKYSPAAALSSINKEDFSTSISVRTLYRYIDNGLFLNLTNKDLPVKGRKKKKNKKVRVQKRASAGTSIEHRPKEVENRNNFGHWEMDTVKGKRGYTKSCLLVLTERKTRNEIIMKLKDQKAESVVVAINKLEDKWGSLFPNVFRSITVDNGIEFSDFSNLEKSILDPANKRTNVYYCHAYSSWERGSNENQNKVIRRHIPKGEDFDNRSDDEIQYIEEWINDYPREMFDYKSSKHLFEKEIAKIRA